MREIGAKEVKEFFERVATDWDTMRLSYYDERVIEKMADLCGANRGMTIADVGTGFVAAGLAPRVGRVIGVDNSRPMLDVARQNLDSLGVGNVELIRGDVTALPLAGGSVDAAVANMVLHRAEDPGSMLREIARMVKAGGAVGITDEVEHPHEWMREEHADVWLGFTEEQIRSLFDEAGLLGHGFARNAVMHPLHDLG